MRPGDLGGQLAGRHDDDGARVAGPRATTGEPMQDRQAEGKRLARAGAGAAEHVVPGQGVGDHRGLDGSRLGDALLGEGRDQRGTEGGEDVGGGLDSGLLGGRRGHAGTAFSGRIPRDTRSLVSALSAPHRASREVTVPTGRSLEVRTLVGSRHGPQSTPPLGTASLATPAHRSAVASRSPRLASMERPRAAGWVRRDLVAGDRGPHRTAGGACRPRRGPHPTDLPGWDVHAVGAHTRTPGGGPRRALPRRPIEFEPPPHVRGLLGYYTEQGVVARRDRTTGQLRRARSARARRPVGPPSRANPPTDGAARPERIFGGVGWDWNRLLRNRPLDVWMHEQDVRRAVGRPGGLDSPAARHTADYLSRVDAHGGRPPGGRCRPAPRWCCGWPVARRWRPWSATTAAARLLAERPREPHGADQHGPRDLHRAGRRPPPPRPRVRSPSRATRSSRRRHPGRDGRHAVTWRRDLPDQTGRTALVTGVHLGGLGYATALELARHGARVIWPVGPRHRLEETERAIRAEVPGADAGPAAGRPGRSGRPYAGAAAELSTPLDLLVNNAGVMAPPYPGPATASSCSWRPTTSARSC